MRHGDVILSGTRVPTLAPGVPTHVPARCNGLSGTPEYVQVPYAPVTGARRPARGSRSMRTKNNEPLVNGQTVEENERLAPQIVWKKRIVMAPRIL